MTRTDHAPPPRTCAVASPHVEATRAATRLVERGGNALDAALAAAVTLCVAYPHNTSVGGDLFALVHSPDGTITSVNASGPAARRVDVGAVRDRHGGRMPLRGIDTVTVPGAVAGLGRLHALGAQLPWGAHFETARELAAQGVEVAPGLARALAEEIDLLRADPGLAAVFVPGGRPLGSGGTLVQPALARTLGRIAEEGPDAFYRGELARGVVAGLRAHGSALDEDDFSSFEPSVGAGISRVFRAKEVWTAAPNSQGFVLLEILCALERSGSDDPLGEGAGLSSALFAAAGRDRERALADPAAMTEPLDRLCDRLGDRLCDLPAAGPAATPATTPAASPATPSAATPRGDTIAVVAADADGWAVSLIQSLFHSFGSGILHEPSGVVFHDRGALFSLDPSSPNVLGPKKRPAHTLMPVLVSEGGRLRWVMGTMGGRAQPQIHTQLLLRLLDGADPGAAVAAARWIVESGGDGDLALVERGVSPSAKAAVAARMAVLELGDLDETVGHAQVVAVDAAGGTLTAGSDPRADGAAAVVEMPDHPDGSPGQDRRARQVASDDGTEGR